MDLNPKQQAFCDFYIETGNAEESARRAGYSARTARGHAHKLLQNVAIKEYIQKRLSEKEKERIASQDEILTFLTSIMRSEVTEQVPVVMQGYFEVVDKQPSIHDRTKAAELLGKRYMMWVNKDVVEGNHSVTFIEDLDD